MDKETLLQLTEAHGHIELDINGLGGHLKANWDGWALIVAAVTLINHLAEDEDGDLVDKFTILKMIGELCLMSRGVTQKTAEEMEVFNELQKQFINYAMEDKWWKMELLRD